MQGLAISLDLMIKTIGVDPVNEGGEIIRKRLSYHLCRVVVNVIIFYSYPTANIMI
ncbi:MAG: hypothetical protein Sapg2KO_52620 [Saprospiraceae bacterium]